MKTFSVDGQTPVSIDEIITQNDDLNTAQFLGIDSLEVGESTFIEITEVFIEITEVKRVS